MTIGPNEVKNIEALLRKEGVTGTIVWLDPNRGDDANFDGTSPWFAYRTMAAALAKVANYHRDAIVFVNMSGVAIDFNVAGDGLTVNVDGLYFLCNSTTSVTNSNVGATSVIAVTANNVTVKGFNIINPSIAGCSGISVTGNNCTIEDNWITGNGALSAYGILVIANDAVIKNNVSRNNLHGIDIQGTRNEAFNNRLESNGIAGTVGIDCSVVASDRNYIDSNIILGFLIGFHAVLGGTINVISKNVIACATIVSDTNPPGSNYYVTNESRGLIVHKNTLEQDLKDIYDAIVGGGGAPTSVGDTYFVDVDGGSDVTGDGSLGNPWKTIDFAVGNCTANHDDNILCWASAGGVFDENTNVAGVICDISGVTITGIDRPQIGNTNGGATSIFYITGSKIKIQGFLFNQTVAVPQIITNPAGTNHITIEDNEIATGANAMILQTSHYARVCNNKILDILGIAISVTTSNNVSIYDNDISNPSTNAIKFNAGASTNASIYKNRLRGNGAVYAIYLTAVTGMVSSNWMAGWLNVEPIYDLAGTCKIVDNHNDKLDISYTVLVASGTAEVIVLDFGVWKSGIVTAQFDMNTLVVAETGKMITVFLKHKIDNNTVRLIDQKSFMAGSNLIHPTLRGYVEGGFAKVELSVKMDTVVANSRILPIKIVMED